MVGKLDPFEESNRVKHLSVFSWGFWGWGTATPQLVSAVDAAERKRGFNPPIFVDIRFRRTGRAPGFKERAFEDLLGWQRYRWMPTLGNSSIGTRKAPRIACPMAANQLLDVVLEGKDRSARVIFFLRLRISGGRAVLPPALGGATSIALGASTRCFGERAGVARGTAFLPSPYASRLARDLVRRRARRKGGALESEEGSHGLCWDSLGYARDAQGRAR